MGIFYSSYSAFRRFLVYYMGELADDTLKNKLVSYDRKAEVTVQPRPIIY